MAQQRSRREVARAAIAQIRSDHGFVSKLDRDEQGFLVARLPEIVGTDPRSSADRTEVRDAEDEIF